jgi:hypothetical protein
MRNRAHPRGWKRGRFSFELLESYLSLLTGQAQSSPIAMIQHQLFEADDRPEQELGWIYNPSAPATNEDLLEFFRTMADMLNQEEGRTAQ